MAAIRAVTRIGNGSAGSSIYSPPGMVRGSIQKMHRALPAAAARSSSAHRLPLQASQRRLFRKGVGIHLLPVRSTSLKWQLCVMLLVQLPHVKLYSDQSPTAPGASKLRSTVCVETQRIADQPRRAKRTSFMQTNTASRLSNSGTCSGASCLRECKFQHIPILIGTRIAAFRFWSASTDDPTVGGRRQMY